MATTPNMTTERRKRSESAFENLPSSLSDGKAFAGVSYTNDNSCTWNFRHVNSINDVEPLLALNIYRAFANVGKPEPQTVAIDERECEIVNRSDMKIAAAFALAGICKLEKLDNDFYITGCQKVVDLEVVNRLDELCEWDYDKLIFHSFLKKNCQLPDAFSRECFQLFLVGKMLDEDGLKKDYFQYGDEVEVYGKVRRYVDDVCRACGLGNKKTLTPMDIIRIKNEIKNYELIPQESEDSGLSTDDSDIEGFETASTMPSDSGDISSDEESIYCSDASGISDPELLNNGYLRLMPQLSFDREMIKYDIRYRAESYGEYSVVGLEYGDLKEAAEVKTKGLDETDKDYFCQEALQRKDTACESVARSFRAAGRWISRNKRNILFNLIDILIGALIGLVLTGIVGAPIYILAALGTLVFWFVLDMVVLGIRKLWHRNKAEAGRVELVKKNTEINDLSISIDSLTAQLEKLESQKKKLAEHSEGLDSQGEEIDSQIEELSSQKQELELQNKELESQRFALEQKQLKHLAFLAGQIGFTDMYNAMLDCDRAANKANALKVKAKDSVEDAIKYAKAVAELTREEERVGKAGKYVAEFLELASVQRSRIEACIERDIEYLEKLGILDPEKYNAMHQDEEVDTSTDDPASIAVNLIDNRGEACPRSSLRKVRSFLWSPTLKEELLNDRRRASSMDKQKLLEKLAKDITDLDPQARGDSVDRVAKANAHIADLAFRAAAGINMKEFVHQANQDRRDDVVKQCAKVSFETFKDYLAYYLRRIPYRLHEAGVSRALIAGSKINAGSLFKDAFPNPVALGGLGIIWWFFFRLLGNAFESKNNKMNQDLTAARLQYENAYEELLAEMKPVWMKDENNKAKQCNGYFNVGVCNRDPQADLSTAECQALRREGKHATAKLMPLLSELGDIQLRLAAITDKVKQEAGPDGEGAVSVESRLEVKRLALNYGLVHCATENVSKQPGQTFYEFGRRLNLKSRQATIVYPSELLVSAAA
ncbi:hypothetical protein ElyMa_003783300 [Elysia marginata]|uniref:Uncharacterized protein n=1 Tax=Elysia marginata TaxID=1093978 RepID=A0AAV4FAB2_9GAST|nr:hypothetical protein ElyMa_003783300 [Elysia marginata]